MKKFFYFIFILFLFLFILTGCKTNENNSVEQVANNSHSEDYSFAVKVSINPELILYLDSEYKVVTIEYINDDAKETFANIDYNGYTFENCIDSIIKTSIEKNYLKENGKVSITTVEIKSETTNLEEADSKIEEIVKTVIKKQDIPLSCSVSEKEIVIPTSSENTTQTVSNSTVETVCTNCKGTGECPGCHGGKDKCPACKGTGYETCPMCNGSGRDGSSSCFGCKGKGSYLCTHCKGAKNAIDCPECKGKFKCVKCNGKGTI